LVPQFVIEDEGNAGAERWTRVRLFGYVPLEVFVGEVEVGDDSELEAGAVVVLEELVEITSVVVEDGAVDVAVGSGVEVDSWDLDAGTED
jgi:hypothetical protein